MSALHSLGGHFEPFQLRVVAMAFGGWTAGYGGPAELATRNHHYPPLVTITRSTPLSQLPFPVCAKGA
jgi:hypothetical protein